MSWQSELVAFSALMFTVILELSFVTIFGILFAFLLSSFWSQKEERGEGSYCSIWTLFTIFSSMPGHLPTGTSLYFQRTNTCFPAGIGEVAWLLWGWELGSFITSCTVLQAISVFSAPSLHHCLQLLSHSRVLRAKAACLSLLLPV